MRAVYLLFLFFSSLYSIECKDIFNKKFVAKQICKNNKCASHTIQTLKKLPFKTTTNKDTLYLDKDTIFTDLNVPNIVITKKITITFKVPQNNKTLFNYQVIGDIIDESGESTILFNGGDYYINSLSINPKSFKPSTTTINPLGPTRLFINKIDIDTNNIQNVSINQNKKTKISLEMFNLIKKEKVVNPEPKDMIIYSNDVKIKTKGKLNSNSYIYSYNDISLNVNPSSKQVGSIHADNNLILGDKLPIGEYKYKYPTNMYNLITCQALPDKPDENVNNQTLLGIDKNSNGIRDDVELYVYKRFSKEDYPKTKIAIALQYAKATQIIIQNPERAYVDKTYSYLGNAGDCKWYWYESMEESNWTYSEGLTFRLANKVFDAEFKDKVFNTKIRLTNYFKFNAALSGNIFNGQDNTIKSCLYNIDELKGE